MFYREKVINPIAPLPAVKSPVQLQTRKKTTPNAFICFGRGLDFISTHPTWLDHVVTMCSMIYAKFSGRKSAISSGWKVICLIMVVPLRGNFVAVLLPAPLK
jgi:hypothetical protein